MIRVNSPLLSDVGMHYQSLCVQITSYVQLSDAETACDDGAGGVHGHGDGCCGGDDGGVGRIHRCGGGCCGGGGAEARR